MCLHRQSYTYDEAPAPFFRLMIFFWTIFTHALLKYNTRLKIPIQHTHR
uniref:Uncharacterized protein n=1 Tax=Arundo donax TaxID=35708 RepID=A0A0A8ZMF4_ARUDO